MSSSPAPEPETGGPEPETGGPEPETEAPEPEEEVINGCTDNTATNYDPDANEDDGSCEYSGEFIIGKDDKCIYVKPRYDVVNGLLYYGVKPDDRECITFNLETNKDGSILDKSSEITISGDMGCLKWNNNKFLEPADCNESSYKFIINDDDTVNTTSPLLEGQSEKLHYDPINVGIMHKHQRWSVDPVLPAKFIKA